MRLIVSGGWFGKSGLYEVETMDVSYPKNLSEIEGSAGFLILSYDLTREFMGVPIKTSGLPPIVFVHTGAVKPLEHFKVEGTHITFKSMNMSKEEFLDKVQLIKEYIARGDVYQINLTAHFTFELRNHPEEVFKNFFLRQEVPYAFFFQHEDILVMSGSMELFLKKEGNIIESRPIKGTGIEPDQILNSSKERAENLMITDMVRNDLGKIASTGSVEVKELFEVRRYRTLCQMHSAVVAETDRSFSEIIANTFPPASVTGAPKHRAVQIIDELENHGRGYYCGSAGFINGEGDFTLSVLIRTAYGGEKSLNYFAGCGIVWDSDPHREWEELLLKVRAFGKVI